MTRFKYQQNDSSIGCTLNPRDGVQEPFYNDLDFRCWKHELVGSEWSLGKIFAAAWCTRGRLKADSDGFPNRLPVFRYTFLRPMDRGDIYLSRKFCCLKSNGTAIRRAAPGAVSSFPDLIHATEERDPDCVTSPRSICAQEQAALGWSKTAPSFPLLRCERCRRCCCWCAPRFSTRQNAKRWNGSMEANGCAASLS